MKGVIRVSSALATCLTLAACSALTLGPQGAERPGGMDGPEPLGMPECRDETYDFAGEGTLAGLGLDAATPVPPPDPNRAAMIWVTHDLHPTDTFGAEVSMARMMCFQFADGSGGSEWPVHPSWRPPGSIASDEEDFPILGVVLVALLVIVISIFAFRPGARSGGRVGD